VHLDLLTPSRQECVKDVERTSNIVYKENDGKGGETKVLLGDVQLVQLKSNKLQVDDENLLGLYRREIRKQSRSNSDCTFRPCNEGNISLKFLADMTLIKAGNGRRIE
jgi:hypothetical protein